MLWVISHFPWCPLSHMYSVLVVILVETVKLQKSLLGDLWQSPFKSSKDIVLSYICINMYDLFIIYHMCLATGFELRASHLQGRCSYCLSHPASPFWGWVFFFLR
jgi:hypothetical protein